MSKGDKNNYELQVYQDKRWIVRSVYGSETEAVKAAEAEVKHAEAVRVMRSWQRIDGKFMEKILLEKKGEIKAKPTAIIHQDEVPMCQKTEDIYGLDSRIIIGRLFRKYLEQHGIIPTELLHGGRHLHRLSDAGTLMTSAISHVAAKQATASGIDSRERSDALFKMIDGVSARARDADATRRLPTVRESGFGGALDELAKSNTEDDCDFLGLAVLTRDLANCRHWLDKFSRVMELTATESGHNEHAVALLDGVLAELLDTGEVIKELLGAQRSLVTALCALCDLAAGKADTGKRPEADPLCALNRLFQSCALPGSSRVLLERVAKELRGTQPLGREDQAYEESSLMTVFARFGSADAFTGTPDMAESLCARAARWIDGGRSEAEQKSIEKMLFLVREPRASLWFLAALAESPLGKKRPDVLLTRIEALFQPANSIHYFCDKKLPVRAKLAAMSSLQRKILALPLPEHVTKRCSDKLDELLAEFIVAERVIERFDNAEDPLRQRATRLVQFCASGLLTDGKALELARKAVVTHLRQPDFIGKLTEGIATPAEQEKVVREFYALMAASGFRA